jgi:hypothetical protein
MAAALPELDRSAEFGAFPIEAARAFDGARRRRVVEPRRVVFGRWARCPWGISPDRPNLSWADDG